MTEPLPPRLYPDQVGGEYIYLGAGTDHIVLREAEESVGDVALKYSRPAFLTCNGGDSVGENYAAAEALAGQINRRYGVLAEEFGSFALRQQSTPSLVYLNSEEVHYIWGNVAPPKPTGMFVTVKTFQECVPALSESELPPDVLPLEIPYAERLTPLVDAETYIALNERWVSQADNTRPPTYDELTQLLAVHHNPSLRAFMQGISNPSDLAMHLTARRFFERCLSYSQRTGEILDMSGARNVLFSTGGNCLLVDALYPEDMQLLSTAPSFIQRMQARELLTRRERVSILNTLGFVRLVNFMAAWYELSPQAASLNSFVDAGITREGWATVYESLTTLLPRANALQDTVSYDGN